MKRHVIGREGARKFSFDMRMGSGWHVWDMKTILAHTSLWVALGVVPVVSPMAASAADAKLYEMRTYHAAPGKMDAVHARFRDHACRLLKKHGMEAIGFWVPMDEKDGAGATLTWVLQWPDRATREKAWEEFKADPEWKAAFQESEKDGKLVEKADIRFLRPTDFSPPIRSAAAAAPRVFELRTYTAEAGRLEALLARFRDHTLKLFERHGMTNVAYWTLTEGEEGADRTLVYMLAHANRDVAKQSFDAFRADPEWQAVKKASEDKAGGSLTIKDGVKSVFMSPTDYSPMR